MREIVGRAIPGRVERPVVTADYCRVGARTVSAQMCKAASGLLASALVKSAADFMAWHRWCRLTPVGGGATVRPGQGTTPSTNDWDSLGTPCLYGRPGGNMSTVQRSGLCP